MDDATVDGTKEARSGRPGSPNVNRPGHALHPVRKDTARETRMSYHCVMKCTTSLLLSCPHSIYYGLKLKCTKYVTINCKVCKVCNGNDNAMKEAETYGHHEFGGALRRRHGLIFADFTFIHGVNALIFSVLNCVIFLVCSRGRCLSRACVKIVRHVVKHGTNNAWTRFD